MRTTDELWLRLVLIGLVLALAGLAAGWHLSRHSAAAEPTVGTIVSYECRSGRRGNSVCTPIVAAAPAAAGEQGSAAAHGTGEAPGHVPVSFNPPGTGIGDEIPIWLEPDGTAVYRGALVWFVPLMGMTIGALMLALGLRLRAR